MSKQENKNSDPDRVFDQSSETAAVLARVDERTKKTNEMLERILEQRIEPLEEEVKAVDNRSRRNELILSAIVTTTTIVGAWSLDLLPV
jgi:hypothetical protein